MKIHSKIAVRLFLLAACTTLASASGITYTCDPNIDAASAGLCNSLNTTISSDYSTIFSNANASIYIQFTTSTPLGESIVGPLNLVSYTSYLNALSTHSSSDTVDTDAVASLGVFEPSLYNGGGIELTSALARALGFTPKPGVMANGAACPVAGTSGCYDGIIDINDPTNLENEGLGLGYYFGTGTLSANDIDIDTLVEFETNNILGLSSCVDTSLTKLADECGLSNPAAVDLFRYQSLGNPVFEDTTPGAYFSYDGGQTATGPPLNTLPGGGEYAAFANTCSQVEDSEACPGVALDISTDGGPEVTMLDTIGYNLNNPVNTSASPTPEPGTLTLLGSGMAGIAALVRRRRTPDA